MVGPLFILKLRCRCRWPTNDRRSGGPNDMVLPKRGGKEPPVKEEEGEEDYDEDEQGSEDDDYVELDLERTLTWTGNAVIIQAGGEFRMPLIVPHPSVLAIQFEVDNGNDIEFSLMFKDDNEVRS